MAGVQVLPDGSTGVASMLVLIAGFVALAMNLNWF